MTNALISFRTKVTAHDSEELLMQNTEHNSFMYFIKLWINFLFFSISKGQKDLTSLSKVVFHNKSIWTFKVEGGIISKLILINTLSKITECTIL